MIHILGFASRAQMESNPEYSGFDELSGLLFYYPPVKPGQGKYEFRHDDGVKYSLFRAIGSRMNGTYIGDPKGQVSLVRREIEGFVMYQIVSGAKPPLIQKGRIMLESGKIQVYGYYYYPADLVLVHF